MENCTCQGQAPCQCDRPASDSEFYRQENLRTVKHITDDPEFKMPGGRIHDLMHGAVSWTYIDSERARLMTRKAIRDAMGWPMTPYEEDRLEELQRQWRERGYKE